MSAPAVFGARHVTPHLGAFLDQHPALELDLFLSDRYVDLLDEGLDVAIRVGLAAPSSLRARRLGGTARHLVASPGYLARAGTPADPGSLRDHRCLLHTGVPRAIWTLRRGDDAVRVDVGGRVAADQSEALRQLAVQGQGIALLATWLVEQDLAAGRLVALLPDWSPPPAPIRALLPPTRRVPARVRALLDHLAACWAGRLGAR